MTLPLEVLGILCLVLRGLSVKAYSPSPGTPLQTRTSLSSTSRRHIRRDGDR